MVVSLFGVVNELGSEYGTFAFFIVIAGVVTIETVFHEVHTMTHDTSYQDMVSAIEKELMIVGIMAFTGKVIFMQVEFSDYEWVHAVEFADLTIPVTSFMYCLIGLVLIIRSASYYKLWSRAYNLKTVELLHDFFEDENFIWGFLRKYFVNTRADEEVEFRILHRIFCDAYSIKNDAINFDQYVILNHEKYLLGLVTISPLSWFVLVATLMLNYFRVHLGWNFYECSADNFALDQDDHYPTGYPTQAPSVSGPSRHFFSRFLGGVPVEDTTSAHDDHALHERHVCQAENILKLYSVAGLGLLIFTIFLAVMARVFVRRIMATKGIQSREDYAIFLQMYDVDENRMQRDGDKMATKELSDALVIAKHVIDVERLDKKAEQYKAMHEIQKKVWVVLFSSELSRWLYKLWTDNEYEDVYDELGDAIRVRLVSFNVGDKDPEGGGEGEGGPGGVPMLGGASRKTVLHDAHLNTHITSETINNMIELKKQNIVRAIPGVDPDISPSLGSGKNNSWGSGSAKSKPYAGGGAAGASALQATSMTPPVPGSRKRGGILVNTADIQRLNLSHALKTSSKSTHGATLADSPLVDAFLFKDPSTYFLIVDSMVMLISFYLGLWITNFDSTASQVEDEEQWRYLTLLPGLLSAAVFGHMVFTCSLLHAIVILDREVVEETIEKRADSARVAQVLRDRLIEQLDIHSDVAPEILLKNLFDVIDEDNSKFLTREELQHFLQGIRISFTKRRWDQIFHEIDANFDDEITFDELLLFVFPDVNAGQEQERRRLQAIGGRLASKGLSHMKLPEGKAYTDAMERICFHSNLTPVDRDELFKQANKQKSASNLLADANKRATSMRGLSFRDLLSGAAKVRAQSQDSRASSNSGLESESESGSGRDVENPPSSVGGAVKGSPAKGQMAGISGRAFDTRQSFEEKKSPGAGASRENSMTAPQAQVVSRNSSINRSRAPSESNVPVGQRSRAASEAATVAEDVLAFDNGGVKNDVSGRTRALTTTQAAENAAGPQARGRAATDAHLGLSASSPSQRRLLAFDDVAAAENAEIAGGDSGGDGYQQQKFSPGKVNSSGGSNGPSSNIKSKFSDFGGPEDMGVEEF